MSAARQMPAIRNELPADRFVRTLAPGVDEPGANDAGTAAAAAPDARDREADSVDLFEIPADRAPDDAAVPLAALLTIDGRNVEVPEHFRAYIATKLTRLERYDPAIRQFNVELLHEPNRRQHKASQRVQITAYGKRNIGRAEVHAETFAGGVEAAVAKLGSSLRKAHDRRQVHYGKHRPVSLAEAIPAVDLTTLPLEADELRAEHHQAPARNIDLDEPDYSVDPYTDQVESSAPGRIVRIKDHPGDPMTVDDALYQMELVGHDFFLFFDKETETPSVVYRRHAFDYGLLRLTPADPA